MRSPRAFTLVELLVVITITGTLMALMLSAIHSSREASRRAQCLNNVRQLAAAALNFHAARETFPPGLEQDEFSSRPRYRGTSLFTFLLPYLGNGSILTDWNYDAPMENTHGGAKARSAKVISGLICPCDPIEENPVAVEGRYFGMTSYGGNGGTRSFHPEFATCDGVFHTTGSASVPEPNQQPVSLSMIRDGGNCTLLFGERSHVDHNLESFAHASWADSLDTLGRWAAIGGRKRIGDVTMSGFVPINYRIPVDYEHREEAEPPMTSSRDFAAYEDRRTCAFGSNHGGGANFAFVDGSARFLSEDLPLDTLQALCTRNGSEIATP